MMQLYSKINFFIQLSMPKNHRKNVLILLFIFTHGMVRESITPCGQNWATNEGLNFMLLKSFGLNTFAWATAISLSFVVSCGNNNPRNNYRASLVGATNQNRYAKFRQMSALALNRKRTMSGGLGLQGKMMMMSLEAQLKAKQEQEKLAATLAIGGGAAALGVGAVGAIATAISSKKADKAEAAAREHYYETELQKAQIKADTDIALAQIYTGNTSYAPGTGRQSTPRLTTRENAGPSRSAPKNSGRPETQTGAGLGNASRGGDPVPGKKIGEPDIALACQELQAESPCAAQHGYQLNLTTFCPAIIPFQNAGAPLSEAAFLSQSMAAAAKEAERLEKEADAKLNDPRFPSPGDAYNLYVEAARKYLSAGNKTKHDEMMAKAKEVKDGIVSKLNALKPAFRDTPSAVQTAVADGNIEKADKALLRKASTDAQAIADQYYQLNKIYKAQGDAGATLATQTEAARLAYAQASEKYDWFLTTTDPRATDHYDRKAQEAFDLVNTLNNATWLSF
jgi:hypothetical protein